MNIYQSQLMDHYHHPRNKGTIPDPDFASEQHNPSCGDSVSMQGKVEHQTVTHIVFEGHGCVISQAVASLLTEHCRLKTVDEIASLSDEFVQELVGTPLGPTRLKCAILPLQALQQAIKIYKQRDTHAQQSKSS